MSTDTCRECGTVNPMDHKKSCSSSLGFTEPLPRKVKKVAAKKGYNLVVILTMPLRFDREHTIGELTDMFEDAAKQLIENIPGAKLNRAPDVGLELDKFPEWKKTCCGPHSLPNLACDCDCHDEESLVPTKSR